MRMLSFLSIVAALHAISATTSARADVLDKIFGGDTAHGLVSIDSVIDAARDIVPGMVIEAELESERGRWVYEVEVVTPEHKEVELTFDATNGALITKKAKHK